VQLLIIDDFLLTPLSDWERRDVLEIVEDRYQTSVRIPVKSATGFAPNRPPSRTKPATVAVGGAAPSF
jgi:hypothetical protein